MASDLQQRLADSGVQYRCGECGKTSRWQREAKLPGQWSLTWVVIDGRSWPKFICSTCNPRTPMTREQSLEAWRERKARSGRKRR